MRSISRAAFGAGTLAVLGAASAAGAATFDSQLYGRWLAFTTTTTGAGKSKVTRTRSVTLTFSANNNLYYEAKTTVNGKDTEKSTIAGVYQVVVRGLLRVSMDPTLGDDPMVWQYQIAPRKVTGGGEGLQMVMIDENGVPQNFQKLDIQGYP